MRIKKLIWIAGRACNRKEKTVKTAEITVDPQKLARAISQVLPCVKRDKGSRFKLNHILFEANGSKLILVACDGYRLATTTLEVPDSFESEWLIPGKDTRRLSRILETAERFALKRESGNGNIVFKIASEGEVKAFAYPIGITGYYQEWRGMFPTDLRINVTFAARDMRKALKVIKIGNEDPVRIYLRRGRHRGEIQLAVKDLGSGEEKSTSIAAKIDGEAGRQAFKWKYLFQLASALGGEITLRTENWVEVKQVLFESGETKWLIMPMLVNWKETTLIL